MVKPLKNPSPQLQANFFSRFFHCWISALVKISHKQDTLHLHDLYDPPSHLESSALTDELETQWFDELHRFPQNPSLLRATIRMVGWRLFRMGLWLIPMECLSIIQPFLITQLMIFFEPCSPMSPWQAWLIASAIILIILCIRLIFHHYVYMTVIHSIKMRVAYSGLIYRKVLRLSSQAMNNCSSGQITNLLANDANKIEVLHYFIQYLWIAPLQTIAIVFLLWYFIKYATFVAIGYTLLLLLIQPILSRVYLRLRAAILKVTDRRVKIMAEIIKSMRIVKMYCWESAFEKEIGRLRKDEMIKTTLYRMCSSIETVLSTSYIAVANGLLYGTMWLLGLQFDIRLFTMAYILLVYLNQSSINYFNFAIADLLAYIAAKKRLEAFLLLDETERDNRLLSTSTIDVTNTQQQAPKLICNLQQAYWDKSTTFTLKNIVFDAHPGDLICIIGPVGSGKSSLLQALTGEIGYFDGKVRLHGTYCYVPQESWIYSSTVKTNILFGKQYNHKLFQRVVHATALETDFIQLSHGVNTLVGDQGVMLSGGQKARVNLARALYRDADIYLLDDPLSAVDAKVSKHLFDKSIKGYLRRKICILVTHQIQFLQDATKIIVLNNGEMAQMGTYEELLTSSSAFAELLEDINQHERKERSISYTNQQSMIGSISSEKDDDDEEKSFLPTNAEVKQEGTVKWTVFVSYLRAGVGVVPGLILIVVIFSAQQALATFVSWWLAAWSNEESSRHRNSTDCLGGRHNKTEKIHNMNDVEWARHRDHRFYAYCVFVLVLWLLIFLRLLVSQVICLNAARVLHNKMFQRVIRSPISFFDMNPVGRILNRFTSDVATMDELLPTKISESLANITNVLGIVILVGVLNPWAFIPAIIASIGMIYVRNQFAPCSRHLKRLIGITRSPVYSQLTSTIHGLKVIRSYHAEETSAKEFFHHLDDNTRVAYLTSTVNRWSAMRFDWISLLFTALVIILAVVARLMHQDFSTIDIALTFVYSLSLMNTFNGTIRQTVEVETQMTSVERILQYCSLEQEPYSSNQHPPNNWPSQGAIIFDHVSMSHFSDPLSNLALQNISIAIHPAEKIGIVGRTGAGKSSFIQSLFRMGTLQQGRIIIDHIDIATIALGDLRPRISIIPQDPVLFTGTIRANLDQFGRCSDIEIWHALEQVQLKSLVKDVLPNGLESMVSEGGSNLSVGQKQLICLARAILKKSRILVIDEATANVDNVTDELIQRAIRDAFGECTVLTVAHRLRTVIDSDRIMVLSDGKVVEFDEPGVLLSNTGSYFSSLVEQTGAAEAEYLRTLANVSKKDEMDSPDSSSKKRCKEHLLMID